MAHSSTTYHEIPLTGCRPGPLLSYLKSLGVLRLVSEQADPTARGWWKNGHFWLSTRLDEDQLVEFFLNDYKPTPIVAPWNGGSGFYLKFARSESRGVFLKSRASTEALDGIERCQSARLQSYAAAIETVRRLLSGFAVNFNHERILSFSENELKKFQKEGWFFRCGNDFYYIDREKKKGILQFCRNHLDDLFLGWLDGAWVLTTARAETPNRVEEGAQPAPLLGTGGNIGNSEMSARFAQLVLEVIKESAVNHCLHGELLRMSLFGSNTEPGSSQVPLDEVSVDQFCPGGAGGANMTQGFEGKPLLNKWDYILMVEGALLFGGAVTKRYGTGDVTIAFPFTVFPSHAGASSPSSEQLRAEQWFPVWEKKASMPEVKYLLSEGRGEFGRKPAENAVEFACAAASLGAERGVTSFIRYQYQKRLGKNYLATPVGTFRVRFEGKIELLPRVNGWLRQVRSFLRGGQISTAMAPFLWRVERAIFDFCKYGGKRRLQDVLIALGAAERSLAVRVASTVSGADAKSRAKIVPPLAGLAHDWITAVDDGSDEFRLALALANIYDPERDPEKNIGPIRVNLEPVEWSHAGFGWCEKNRRVVWSAADLEVNLVDILYRRVMDGLRAGCKSLPLESRYRVPLSVVARFLHGTLDLERVENLFWGLILVGPGTAQLLPREDSIELPLPRQYALLKLLFLPGPLKPVRLNRHLIWSMASPEESVGVVRIRPELRIISLLTAGRIGEACRIAAQRLRASGMVPMPGPSAVGAPRDDTWGENLSPRMGKRLAAALLIPCFDVNKLVSLVCRPPAELVAEGAEKLNP